MKKIIITAVTLVVLALIAWGVVTITRPAVPAVTPTVAPTVVETVVPTVEPEVTVEPVVA